MVYQGHRHIRHTRLKSLKIFRKRDQNASNRNNNSSSPSEVKSKVKLREKLLLLCLSILRLGKVTMGWDFF